MVNLPKYYIKKLVFTTSFLVILAVTKPNAIMYSTG